MPCERGTCNGTWQAVQLRCYDCFGAELPLPARIVIVVVAVLVGVVLGGVGVWLLLTYRRRCNQPDGTVLFNSVELHGKVCYPLFPLPLQQATPGLQHALPWGAQACILRGLNDVPCPSHVTRRLQCTGEDYIQVKTCSARKAAHPPTARMRIGC